MILGKLKTHKPYDLEIPCPGIYSREMLACLCQELCARTTCLLVYLVRMLTFVLASLEHSTEGVQLACVIQHFWLLMIYWKLHCSRPTTLSQSQTWTTEISQTVNNSNVSTCEQLKCPCINELCYFIRWNYFIAVEVSEVRLHTHHGWLLQTQH